MKAPWRRLLDIWSQSFLGRQDIAGNLGNSGDVIKLLPRANGELAWQPSSPAAEPSIGLDVIWQPGGVAANNVYTTEATVFAALATILASSGGPVTLGLDTSLGAAALTAAHDWTRIALVSARGRDSGANGGGTADILTVNDGALQTGLGIQSVRGVFVILNPTTGPVLAYPVNKTRIFLTEGAQFGNIGSVPACQIGALTLYLVEDDGALLLNPIGPGSEVFNLSVAASRLFWTGYNSGHVPGSGNETNVIAGVAGSVLTLVFDASRITTNASFAGTLNTDLIDAASRELFSQALQPAPVLPLVNMTTQQAVDMHESPVNGVGANYIVDTLGLDETIVLGADGLTISIPAGFPIGRELTIIDATPGVAGFTIHPAPTEQIGALAVGTNRQVLNAEALAVTIKKTGAVTWRFKSSTLSS